MSNEALNCAWRSKIDSPAQKAVLVVLADFANQDLEAFPSIQTIVDFTAFSERTVRQALRDLEAGGWVTREDRVDAKTGRMKPALYRLVFMHDAARMRAPRIKGAAAWGANAAAGEGATVAGGGGDSCRGEGATVAPEPLLRTPNEPALHTQCTELPLGLPAAEPTKPVPAPRKIDLAPLVATWNAVCGPTVGKIRKLSPDREKWVRKAMAEDFGNDTGQWEAFCQRVAASPFLTGRTGSSFRPDFSWIIDPDNLVRVLEGRYDNDRNRPAPLAPGQRREAPGTI